MSKQTKEEYVIFFGLIVAKLLPKLVKNDSQYDKRIEDVTKQIEERLNKY